MIIKTGKVNFFSNWKTVDISVSGTRQEMEEISSQFSKESESEELLFRNVNVNILLCLMFIKKTFDERTDNEEYTRRQQQHTKNQLSQQQQQRVNGRNRQLQQQQQIRSLFGQH